MVGILGVSWGWQPGNHMIPSYELLLVRFLHGTCNGWSKNRYISVAKKEDIFVEILYINANILRVAQPYMSNLQLSKGTGK